MLHNSVNVLIIIKWASFVVGTYTSIKLFKTPRMESVTLRRSELFRGTQQICCWVSFHLISNVNILEHQPKDSQSVKMTHILDKAAKGTRSTQPLVSPWRGRCRRRVISSGQGTSSQRNAARDLSHQPLR